MDECFLYIGKVIEEDEHGVENVELPPTESSVMRG